MMLSEIDRELALWRDKQRLIADNLKSFADLTVWKRLSGEGGQAARALAGQTQARVGAAVETLQSLREQQAILVQTLDRAQALAASISRLMPSRQTLQEIEQLLRGPSIQLASAPTAPERRELLRDVTQTVAVTPDRLLEIMLESFRFVRDSALAVTEADERIAAALERHEAELTRLRGVAGAASGAAAGKLAAAKLAAGAQAISDLKVQADYDPLGAEERCAALAALLQSVGPSLDDAAAQRRQVDTALADAKGRIATLRQTHERAKQKSAERELKVELARDPSAPTVSGDGELAAIDAWLVRLQQTVAKGDYAPALVGLRKWNEAAAKLLAADQGALEADASVLGARRELRGLFDALQAKACANGRAEDPHLSTLGQEVRRLLGTRPTPLTRTRELVARYEEGLL